MEAIKEVNKTLQEDAYGSSVRVAEPTAEDAEQFCVLGDLANRGMMAKMLGPTWKRPLLKAFVKSNHNYSYERTYFITGKVEGGERKVLAMLNGCTTEENASKKLRHLALATVGRGRLLRAMREVWSIREAMEFSEKREDKSYYTEMVAVYPEARGRSYASALFRVAEARARETGCTSLSLDCDVENESAHSIYLKMGFVDGPSSPEGVVDRRGAAQRFVRMVKALE